MREQIGSLKITLYRVPGGVEVEMPKDLPFPADWSATERGIVTLLQFTLQTASAVIMSPELAESLVNVLAMFRLQAIRQNPGAFAMAQVMSKARQQETP